MKKILVWLIVIISILCTSCDKKASEIALTPENFENFYDISFYNDGVVESSIGDGLNGYRTQYTTNLILEVKPKRLPGTFKAVDVKFSIEQITEWSKFVSELLDDYNYDFKWEMTDDPNLTTGTDEYEFDDTERTHTIRFQTAYIEMPLKDLIVIKFPMISKHSNPYRLPRYEYNIDYSIIDVKGSYIPIPNEDVSEFIN